MTIPHMPSAFTSILCAAVLLPSIIVGQNRPGEQRIDSLISVMTIEEKCGQLNQINGSWTEEKGSFLADSDMALVTKGMVGSVLNFTGASAVARLQHSAVTGSRLHIPVMTGLDVIHGYRTIFPVPIAEASTWDPELIERTSRIAATEASAAGVDWTFAPMVDIARDPRWGRIVEGSGEDPYLGSVLAAARVRGFQGKELSDPRSILACAKHYAAYGAAEAGRDYNTADIPERTLREIYLPPFRAAVKAGAGSLMSSFNEIAGVPATANRFIMTDILRREWGFDGFVVSDWTAIAELLQHGVSESPAGAGALAINAGVDMDMVSRIYLKELPGLVRNGTVSETVLDEAVRRVLREKMRLGLFDNPEHGASPGREQREILTDDNLSAALESAQKAIVLLRNEHFLLPLSRSIGRIALIGPLADDGEDPLGPWDCAGRPSDVVTVIEGMKHYAGPGTEILFSKGCSISGSDTGLFADAVSKAKDAGIAVLVLGESREMSGEASSRSDIGLPGVQQELLRRVLATGTPTILVLMNGRPLTLQWEAEHVPAILETWFLGVRTGTAVARVLFGDVNPSGRLPVTFPRVLGQVPLYYNHKNTGRPYIDEKEKFASRYLDIPNTPLFPFGYGLSYTSFRYSDLGLSKSIIRPDGSTEVSVNVTNTGSRAGEEVVQCYIRDMISSVTRPVRELKGFHRVNLKPGESATVRFSLGPAEFSFLDAGMNPVVEPGVFMIFTGGNSEDLISTDLTVTGK